MMLIPKAYRAKETVEAVQLTEENALEVALWVGGHIVKKISPKSDGTMVIDFELVFQDPRNGYDIRADNEWWVVREKTGRMTVMTDEGFKRTYDEDMPISYKGVMVEEDHHDIGVTYTNHDDGLWLVCQTCGFNENLDYTPSLKVILAAMIRHWESLHPTENYHPPYDR